MERCVSVSLSAALGAGVSGWFDCAELPHLTDEGRAAYVSTARRRGCLEMWDTAAFKWFSSLPVFFFFVFFCYILEQNRSRDGRLGALDRIEYPLAT